MSNVVIAVDGPVAAGKGTLARRLAAHLGLQHLDSGMIYRAAAARLLETGGQPVDAAAAEAAAKALSADDLTRPNLRDQAIGGAASKVAVIPAVRAALLEFQRRFVQTPPGAVIDGRDIGTVVCPDANVKLYVTASLDARAGRRHAELEARDGSADFKAIRAEISERDRRDMERETAPLRQADDAVTLDTSDLDADMAFQAALEIIEQSLKQQGNIAIESPASA
ncbi:MAG: (d)CMP kinase [Rhodospirillaceae bacterium]|nr:(d)CMP kinase [Rhodospirillaceae bacterium]